MPFYYAMDDRNIAALDLEDNNLARLNWRLKMNDDDIFAKQTILSFKTYLKRILDVSKK